MWIMVAGPYGLVSQPPEQRRRNLEELAAAYAVYKKGHVPVIGLNLALAITLDLAVAFWNQDVTTNQLQLVDRTSLAAAERCEAVLRIGGPSTGADDEVRIVAARGGPVYRSIEEIPDEM
jgi:poly(A) polymerase Pap1